jgi:hypothetical protein
MRFRAWLQDILIFLILGGNEMKYSGLAMVYAYLIIDGAKEFSEVPKRLKNQVKEVLESLGAGDLAVESGK